MPAPLLGVQHLAGVVVGAVPAQRGRQLLVRLRLELDGGALQPGDPLLDAERRQRAQHLVGETGQPEMLAQRPAARGVHQVADPGPGERDGAGGPHPAREAQLGGLDPAQRQLLVRPEVELPGYQAGALEPGVGEPDPAERAKRRAGRVERRVLAVPGAVVRAGAGPPAVRRAGQVQGVADREPHRVQAGAVVRQAAELGTAQREPAADPGGAQAQLTGGLQPVGLEVLVDVHAVGGERAAEPVGADDGLVEQQVGADPGVGEPDAPGDPAAGEMKVTLGGQSGGLDPGQQAAHEAQRAGPCLGQQQGVREPAVVQFDVVRDGPAGQHQRPGDVAAGELQRGHPSGHRGRAVQQQPGEHLRADRPPGPPDGVAEDRVPLPVAARQVVDLALAECLPQPLFDRCPVVRRLLHDGSPHDPRSSRSSYHGLKCGAARSGHSLHWVA